MIQDENCTEKSLIQKFTDYTVENQAFPKKKDLAKQCNQSVEEFNAQFRSVKELKAQFWLSRFEETVLTLAESEEYDTYAVRDKMLAFYYTWIEELKPFRAYIKFVFTKKPVYKVLPDDTDTFVKSFNAYTDTLLEQGKESGEIAKRLILSNQLKKILYLKLVFILRFWLHDKSEDYSQTDAAIEKSVHLAFDILGKTPIDTAFDFGKFVIQNRIKSKPLPKTEN